MAIPGLASSSSTEKSRLEALPKAAVADHFEVLRLIDTERLYGRGLGWWVTTH